ncbi:uncharacterized protein EV420DRAFT_1765338 [Desarmillaria tabescens]|uniref:Uncharacterized protein n=1 Tax=Armillaria tabescens TaxID=1929756 RepID=A0AA39KBC1_ARMTA|nr:uncharacterized protein EV420DRAFT_1765338 [Desarmillaria tabescens]KAK0455683.1 hypothetical protein EV420DRAFT_1765338 [Desarmillaria tabescens]
MVLSGTVQVAQLGDIHEHFTSELLNFITTLGWNSTENCVELAMPTKLAIDWPLALIALYTTKYQKHHSKNAASKLREEMMRAHMRVMVSAPAHGEYTTSGYPSEAILAEAAAISIHEERLDMVEVVHRLLEDKLGMRQYIDMKRPTMHNSDRPFIQDLSS